MPSNNHQVKFRLSDAQIAEVQAVVPADMTIGAYAKHLLLLAARSPGVKGAATKRRREVESREKLEPEVMVQDQMRGTCDTHGNLVIRNGRCAQVGCKG